MKPKIKGFQNTQFGKKLNFIPFEQDDKFVQILHVQSCHWMTISNMNCQKNEVIVYDSHFNGLTFKTKLQICRLMNKYNLESIRFLISNIQRQTDSSMCGLFAIAVATELAHGFDPISCCWHSDVMRSHLCECLEKKNLVPFPKNGKKVMKRNKRYIRVVDENLYCKCREVNDVKRGMIRCFKCSSWYHLDCIGLDNIPKIWQCEKCTD